MNSNFYRQKLGSVSGRRDARAQTQCVVCKAQQQSPKPRPNPRVAPQHSSASRPSTGKAAATPGSGGVQVEGSPVVVEPASPALMDEPLSPMDVDAELWSVLDICSDDELETLYNILHSASPFSPIIKSLVVERDEPPLISARGRRSVMHKVESHLRFLAAGSGHLLRGARPSYREILLNVRDKLDVRCSRNLGTYDLETEIFLHCLNHCAEYVGGGAAGAAAGGGGAAGGVGGAGEGAVGGAGVGTGVGEAGAAGLEGAGGVEPVDPSRAASFAMLTTVDVVVGGGGAAGAAGAAGGGGRGGAAAGAAAGGAGGGGRGAAEAAAEPSSSSASTSGSTSGSSSTSGTSSSSSGSSGSGRGNWTERLTAPLRLGLKDLAPTLLNLAGAVTVTKVGQQAAQQLASNLVCSHLKYQAALRAATGLGGLSVKGAVAGWGKQAVLEAAQRSLTAATARYAALRGALSLLGPLMWGWLALDLALKAIGPDYARVVRAVFLLSQVRLVRTHGFVSGEMAAAAAAAASTYESDFGLEEEDDYYDPGAAVPWL